MTLKRRNFIRNLGAISTLVIASWFAGCSDSTSSSGGGIRVVEGHGEWTTFGNVEYTVTVENTASESKTGTLYLELTFDNGASYRGSKYVRVPGGESKTVDLKIEVSIFDTIPSEEVSPEVWFEEN